MKSRSLLFAIIVPFLFFSCNGPSHDLPKPNILWITSEDMNAFIGAYGDELALTPNLDKLAEEGVRYTHAFATAPVCSPSRSCLVTGVYATSMGTQHLRSEIEIPSFIKGFPEYLRASGYYCSNNGKEDYNFDGSNIWDETSETAHWRKRQDGQPFFSVFNIHTTHQSQVFGTDKEFYEKYGKQLSEAERQNPDEMAVPPYHFDTPTVRKLWARYYDLVTLMDKRVGEILAELEEDGLAENTIVFYFADHGTGMPRSKRALYDSGLRVPLIIKAPKAYQEALGLTPGSENGELVNFADFAPTVLSMLGLDIPSYMQGIPFLGKKKQTQEYAFGHSDRVDEAFEISRTVRGKKYRYIRNYLSHLPLIQPNFYTDQSEIMQELLRAKNDGKLSEAQASMWTNQRLQEELYDTETDPFETNNLANDPAHQETLMKMRRAQQDWAKRTFDSGLMLESDMHGMAEGTTIYEMLRDPKSFPIDKICGVTDMLLEDDLNVFNMRPYLQDVHPGVRFWSAMAYQIKGWDLGELHMNMQQMLLDPASSVRVAAAENIISNYDDFLAKQAIVNELNEGDKFGRLHAARAFELHVDKLKTVHPEVMALKDSMCVDVPWPQYYDLYTCWALEEAFK